MPCDTRLKSRQTIQQRAEEVRTAAGKVSSKLATGKVQVVIDRRTGAVAFRGMSEEDRDGLTDACIYRRIMVTGSALAKQAIARAEQLAGRTVNKQAIAQGHHSHDGGATWHHGH